MRLWFSGWPWAKGGRGCSGTAVLSAPCQLDALSLLLSQGASVLLPPSWGSERKGTSLHSNVPLRAEVSCLKCAFSQIPICMCLCILDCCGYFKILKTIFLARLIIFISIDTEWILHFLQHNGDIQRECQPYD